MFEFGQRKTGYIFEFLREKKREEGKRMSKGEVKKVIIKTARNFNNVTRGNQRLKR